MILLDPVTSQTLDLTLLTQRQFSPLGSLLIVAVLLVPFFIAWAVSVYENRLLWWFSEGTEVLTKGNIIASVMSATAIPCFMISFGVLGVATLFGDTIGFAEMVDGTARPSATQTAVYLPMTVLVSIVGVLLLRRLAYRKKLPNSPETRGLYLKWVMWLNVVGQVLMLGFLWGVLFLFPELVNLALQ